MKISFEQGSVPLLVSFPHSSTSIPSGLAQRMTEQGRGVPDTDWFLPRLFEFIADFGVSVISANFSRFVIDPDQSTEGQSPFPERPASPLCPVHCLDGSPIYLTGEEPDQFEIGERTSEYWRHYHDDVLEELLRIKHQHGQAVLLDVHSIRSQVPRLFDGQIPDISIGTLNGKSCDAVLQDNIERVLQRQSRFTHVANGRFAGGFMTRSYGDPRLYIQAIRLQLSHRSYMDEAASSWHDKRATEIRPLLHDVVKTLLNWTREQKKQS